MEVIPIEVGLDQGLEVDQEILNQIGKIIQKKKEAVSPVQEKAVKKKKI